MRRGLVLFLLAAAWLSAAPASAAVKVSFEQGPPTAYPHLYFGILGSERSDLVDTAYDGRGFAVTSNRSIKTSGYCRRTSPTSADCTIPDGPWYGMGIGLHGGDGDDQLSFSQPGKYPGVEHVFMDGGAGSDRLVSGSGFDYLVGGTGNDLLMSQGGPDRVKGGPDADDLRCGSRRDEYEAGPRDLVRKSCEDGPWLGYSSPISGDSFSAD